MKINLPLSDEMLNAFVDDELEGDDREQIILLEQRYPEVAKAINDKRRLKYLVKSARRPEPTMVSVLPGFNTSRARTWSTVASLLLVLVVAAGSIYFGANHFYSGLSAATVAYNEKSTFKNSSSLLQAASQEENLRLVFHLNSMNSESTTTLLQTLDALLLVSRQHNKHPQVEVIATGPGIMLLTTGSQQLANEHIHSISKQFANVAIIACNTSLQRVQKSTNSRLQLIQKAMLVASGKQWLQHRKQQGWSYINI